MQKVIVEEAKRFDIDKIKERLGPEEFEAVCSIANASKRRDELMTETWNECWDIAIGVLAKELIDRLPDHGEMIQGVVENLDFLKLGPV